MELQAVRKRSWKFHFPHAYRHVAAVGSDGNYGEVANPLLEQSLFHLELDPSEQYSVVQQHPQVARELQQLGYAFARQLMKEKNQR